MSDIARRNALEELPHRDADFEEAAMESLGSNGGPTGHPKGLYLLFTTEMWERFSYYGMRAFLILYMVSTVAEGGLGWTKEKAGTMYGWYTGLCYLTPLFGGYIADKLIGTHYSMLLGGAIIAAGHFTLAFETIPSFYAGLGLIIIGTGFFKPCVSVMVGQLYPERDRRRDAAFTIFYMGINLGAFLGPIICGGLRLGRKQGEVFGWSWAFAAAGVGMVLGLIAYLAGRPWLLRGVGATPKKKDVKGVARLGAVFAALGLVALILGFAPGYEKVGQLWASFTGTGWLLYYPAGIVVAIAAIAGISAFVMAQEPKDRGPVAAIFIMAFFVIFFWTAFEQAGSSMNLFAQERVDRTLSPATAHWVYDLGVKEGFPLPSWAFLIFGAVLTGGWIAFERGTSGRRDINRPLQVTARVLGLAIGPILILFGGLKWGGFLGTAFFPPDFLEKAEYPPDWFQSVNAGFILLLAPIFASAWLRLARKSREPSTPVKFAAGLILLGVGFVFMVLAAQQSMGSEGAVIRVTGLWLVAAYCLHTMGELCLSPVGLSMVNKLAPVRFASLLMGVWFLANFVANTSAGLLAGQVDEIAKGHVYRILGGQADFYLMFVAAPILAGLVLLAITPIMKKLMAGRA